METSSAVVLAGGLGTRIRHLTGDLPKPMVDVAGRPFLEWVLRFLAANGVNRMIVSAGYKAETISAFVPGLAIGEIAVAAEPEPLGTGGGFLHSIANDDAKAWVVCNGDSLVLTDLRAFLAAIPDDADAALVAVEQEGDRFGRLRIAADGFLQAFEEKRGGTGPVNAGVYVFRRAALSHFPEGASSLERDILPKLPRVWVHAVKAPFIDIGTEESLGEAERFVRANGEWFA